MSPVPWWRPEAHADRRPLLLLRGRIARSLRDYFAARDFLEVECGALQVSPGNEAHLHAFSTRMVGPDGAGGPTLFLHTSPEFACKKLLAAGERRIFDFARVYRNREAGPLHAPEFTMLEWYRAGEAWTEVMNDAVELCRHAARCAGGALRWRGRAADPFAEPERLTLAEAFDRHAGLDLGRWIDDPDVAAFDARRIGLRVGAGDVWSDLFSRVVVERIEPKLGEGRLTLLCEYPTSEAALARPLATDRRYSERFELYACGVELANGFGELTDPVEQRRRFEAEMDVKADTYGERYPLDEEFLAALEAMPDASGVALGFDRLVMLAAGAERIDQVLWTPLSQPR